MEEATLSRRNVVWGALIGGGVTGVAAFGENPHYSVEGSGDAAQVLATLLVAVALEARVLSTAIRVSGYDDRPLLTASILVSGLSFFGPAIATTAAVQSEPLGRFEGAVVQATVVALLVLVLGAVLFGAKLLDDRSP